MSGPIKLEFSEQCDQPHAKEHFQKHQEGLSRKLSHRRDVQLARRALALAGEPGLVLDVPCGAGRFWPMLTEKANRVIIGADNSADMLKVACKSQPQEVVERIRLLQTSVFAIDLPDNAVDSIVCMRFMHHIGEVEHRKALLSEFHRVSRDSVIVSLWVDGNFKAWKRKKLEKRREQEVGKDVRQNRFVISAETAEKEFVEAGFKIQERLDFLPLYAMRRVYLLRKG
jgi:ubiquinone/menaquinone biosynthesis C-methylase UbiE